MEELHSTEVLDREILEDARKKAFKILKTADDTVASQRGRWERKTKRALADLQKNYAQRLETSRQEIVARLPLDKRRLRSQTTETFLKAAMDGFLAALPRRDLLAALEEDFCRLLEDCEWSGRRAALYYSGMSLDEAREVCQNAAKRAGGLNAAEWEFREAAGGLPAVVLDAPEARLRAGVEDVAAELLETNRAELVKSLLGEGALND